MPTTRKEVRIALAAVATVALVAFLVAPTLVLAQSKSATGAVDTLDAVVKEVTKIRTGVQGAMDSLNTLTTGEPKDLPKNYKAYSKYVTDMTKASETTAKRAEDMKTRREAYLAEWEKKMGSISDPEIKAHMATRQEQVKKTFETVQPPAQAARETFPAFLSKLQDIEKLLSMDLSASGVSAAAPIAQKAIADGTTVTTNLDTVIATLTQIKEQVSPTTKK